MKSLLSITKVFVAPRFLSTVCKLPCLHFSSEFIRKNNKRKVVVGVKASVKRTRYCSVRRIY